MTIIFYILWLAVFVVSFYKLLAFFRLANSFKKLERLSTNDNLIKDPQIFHFSIIYLLNDMARAEGDYTDYNKLQFIYKYIVEAVPDILRYEAIVYFNTLTRKNDFWNSEIINLPATKRKNKLVLKNEQDFGYGYMLPIEGKKMAEELGNRLSDRERLYILSVILYGYCRWKNFNKKG